MYQLDINKNEVYRYLGYGKTQPDDQTVATVEDMTNILKSTKTYKADYKIFSITKTDAGVQLDDTTLVLAGNDITKMLSTSTRCILMAVTLGHEAETISRTLQIKDMAKALIFDSCASSMVENLCDQLEARIKVDIDKQNLHLTDRFSPGYGDLSISVQHTIADVLNTQKTMGLCVTSSGIMVPRKSITAIIGIADTPQQMRIKGCKYCSLIKDCTYRKSGKTCS